MDLLRIAKYLISNEKITSGVRLQKIIYFIYKEYLIKYSKRPFDVEFEAWIKGPVSRELYFWYKDYLIGNLEIDEIIEQGYFTIDDIDLKLIVDEVCEKYKFVSIMTLINLSHDSAWLYARGNLDPKDICQIKLIDKNIKK